MSVYFEADEHELVVYVTDQGKGFDPDAVDGDRKGIADSIQARMKKVGGDAAIVSAPGEGTEVILRLALEPK